MQTVSNVASTTLESALPTATATSTLLAPEEIYSSEGKAIANSKELTPAEKRKARAKRRKQKAAMAKKNTKLSGEAATPRQRKDRKDKAQAMKELKNKKGVTIAGGMKKQGNNKISSSASGFKL